MSFTVYHARCEQQLDSLPDNSIAAIITDPPYGVTSNKWDRAPNFHELWPQLSRICGGVACIFGVQPFSSHLVSSNPRGYKYELIWDRVNKWTNFLNARRMPLRRHETILVFDLGGYHYTPQMELRATPFIGRRTQSRKSSNYNSHGGTDLGRVSTHRYPSSIISIKGANTRKGIHPNEKPVELMRYLVRTHTRPGDTVLDPFMGRGSTGAACLLEGRNFIGIEADAHWFKEAEKRLSELEAA